MTLHSYANNSEVLNHNSCMTGRGSQSLCPYANNSLPLNNNYTMIHRRGNFLSEIHLEDGYNRRINHWSLGVKGNMCIDH